MFSAPFLANRLLAAMPRATLHRWEPWLSLVELKLGAVIHEPGTPLTHVLFPTTTLVSLVHVLKDGSTAEIALTGRDGVVGVSLFMGGSSTLSRGVVQSAGDAYRLPTSALMSEFNQAGPAMRLLLRYTQALITQMAQTAACNRHHAIEQQLCRWLLLSLDLLDGPELIMTQELIANMLGVRREGVAAAAAKLQRAGLIRYSRGRILVRDRSGLEQCSCECYAVVKAEYEHLLPKEPGTGSHGGARA